MRHGEVDTLAPRREVQAAIQKLMRKLSYANLADFANCGKGGIRTLEGVSHPLPA
jgi:hypothetical protein